jgi:MOSC domain-containing protein YiiM
LDNASVIARLLNAPMQPGCLLWIGLRTARRGPVTAVETAELDPDQGLVGDRYAGRTGTRQVTLVQHEHLSAIGAYLGQPPTDPARLRRNLVIAGLNLLAAKDQILQIGTATLKITGQCHPCSRMEEELGPGGYNAVRGHGGLTARVLQPGTIQLGDPVERNNS